VERRRPGHPHPEASQSGVREVAVAWEVLPCRLLLSDGLRNPMVYETGISTQNPGLRSTSDMAISPTIL
jgi:hypothetical protein